MSDKPFLGLYVIVRDAEKTIDALLASLRGADGKWAFDELVFVDTGSIDSTRAKLADAFKNLPSSADFSPAAWIKGGYEIWYGGEGEPRIRLASFKWIDDFAAARNFAFSLGTARWRMWLDADDQLVIDGADAHHLAKALKHSESKNPDVDTIMLRYEYAPPFMAQDKFRILRWDTGWRWEGQIHEEIVPYPLHGKRIAVYGEVKVIHEGGDTAKSIARNTAMCTRIYDQANTSGDVVKRARMAYYLGMYASMQDRFDDTIRYCREAGENLGFTNLAAYALTDLAYYYLKHDLPHEAIKVAGEAHARCPEIPDGLGALAVALEAAGEHVRACTVFDQWRSNGGSPIQSNRDTYRTEGMIPIAGVRAYLDCSRINDAGEMLKRVNRAMCYTSDLHIQFTAAGAKYFQALGLLRLKDFVDYLVWSNDVLDALHVLDTAVPSNIRALPEVSQIRKAILDKTPQIESWTDYKRVYAAETNEIFDRDEKSKELITLQGRAVYVKQWAERLPKSGPPIELYVIGVHGGWIEQEVLAANPRINLTACDVNPNANYALQRLAKLFPNRVQFHTVVTDHYDWIPEGRKNSFDALFCFEVIEHVPNPHYMARQFTNLLKPQGELFLSTPISSYWVEPDATKRHHWHQHLTAWEPYQLWGALYNLGFRGDMKATDNRVLHLCHMKWNGAEPENQLFDTADRITIWCPHIHRPFDPSSLTIGHLGGSEEAVVHLSRALVRSGARVTVYGQPPDQENRVHVDQGVLWMENRYFDPLRLSGTVLVWRAPTDAAWLKKQVGSKVRVLNWLHDTSYSPVSV